MNYLMGLVALGMLAWPVVAFVWFVVELVI